MKMRLGKPAFSLLSFSFIFLTTLLLFSLFPSSLLPFTFYLLPFTFYLLPFTFYLFSSLLFPMS